MRKLTPLLILVITLGYTASCSSPHYQKQIDPYRTHYWTASYYGKKFHGRPTASGEIYDMYGISAAHKSLPFGTRLDVTNTENGRSVLVTVNDRGPFIKGRQLDLSYGAAKEIGMITSGIAKVRVRILNRDSRYVKTVSYRSSAGPFTIQTGSFREKENALRHRSVLSYEYRNVYIVRVRINDVVYYRVCIGKFSTRNAADKIAERLADEGYGVIVINYDERT